MCPRPAVPEAAFREDPAQLRRRPEKDPFLDDRVGRKARVRDFRRRVSHGPRVRDVRRKSSDEPQDATRTHDHVNLRDSLWGYAPTRGHLSPERGGANRQSRRRPRRGPERVRASSPPNASTSPRPSGSPRAAWAARTSGCGTVSHVPNALPVSLSSLSSWPPTLRGFIWSSLKCISSLSRCPRALGVLISPQGLVG